jgi:hypothetical protein
MEALQEKTESLQNHSDDLFSQKYLKNSFLHFFFLAFSVALRRVEGVFVEPYFLKHDCYRLQFCNRTSTVKPRYHLKSTLVEAYVAWKVYRMEHAWNEFMYMGYTTGGAEYHTKRIKRYISALPELFGGYRNVTDSESILYYRNSEDRIFYCEPVGILTAQRGKHPHEMICDDILRDPQVKLDLSQLEKIERTFFEEVEQMPKEKLHLVGTPQDAEDLFSKLDSGRGYDCKRYDAIVDEIKGIALWENNPKFCFKELQNIRLRIGDKAFMKEFRVMPVRGAEGFISLEQLCGIIRSRLKNYDVLRAPKLKKRTCVGGFDIGKKTHPSHLAVFAERVVNGRRKLVQIHSKFMDGWNYTDQIAYCKQAIEVFEMDLLAYDNTRAEFETSEERGDLPSEMTGIVFTAKSKFTMATELDKVITNKEIELLDDGRQKRQILTVDCDLKAPETSEGHGDSFFSLCLAVSAWRDAQGCPVWDLN